MSEQTLLLRCRQTIQILNETIVSHKKDIERLEARNRSLNSELQINENLRFKLIDQVSALKRSATQQKADKMSELYRLEGLLSEANRQIDSKRSANVGLQRKVNQCEKEIQQLKNRIKRKDQGFEFQQKQLNRRIINLQKNNTTIFNERDQLIEQSHIYKKEIAELKIECESLNSQLEHSRSIHLKTTNEAQKQIQSYGVKHGQYHQIISILEQQKLQFLRIIDKQRITIEDYKQMVDRVQYHNRSLKTQVDQKDKQNSLLGKKEFEISSKKKGKMFQKLMEIELGVRRMMQEMDCKR